MLNGAAAGNPAPFNFLNGRGWELFLINGMGLGWERPILNPPRCHSYAKPIQAFYPPLLKGPIQKPNPPTKTLI